MARPSSELLAPPWTRGVLRDEVVGDGLGRGRPHPALGAPPSQLPRDPLPAPIHTAPRVRARLMVLVAVKVLGSALRYH